MAAGSAKWTRERVVRELKSRAGKGRSIRFDASPGETEFLDALHAQFGGWDHALRAACLHPKTRLLNYWTRDEVTKRIRQLAERNEPINTLYLETNYPRLWNAARWIFKNIEKAVEAAGFSYKNVRKRNNWTDEEIMRRIRKHHGRGQDISQTAMSDSDSKLLAAGQKFFGSWRRAVEAAGIDYAEVKERRKAMKRKRKSAANGAPRRPVYVMRQGRLVAMHAVAAES